MRNALEFQNYSPNTLSYYVKDKQVGARSSVIIGSLGWASGGSLAWLPHHGCEVLPMAGSHGSKPVTSMPFLGQ